MLPEKELIADVLRRYDNVFIRLDSLPHDVPPEVAVMFRLTDVSKLWKYGHDKDLWTIASSLRNNHTEFIAAPQRFKIFVDGNIQLEYPNGCRISVAIQQLGETPEDVLSAIRSYHYVTFENTKPKLRIIKRTEDITTAAELIDKLGIVGALQLCFGVDVTPASLLVFVPRYLPLIKHPTITPPTYNICQMTLPNTGKSYLAIIYTLTFMFEYFTSMPTPARLVFDASIREYGAVFTRNGLIFDEIDKWKFAERENFKRTYATLLTGLENGVWSRETSRYFQSDRVIFVPAMMFTNIRYGELEQQTPRETFERMIASWGGENPTAFTERFTVVQKCLFRYTVTDHTTGYTCIPSVRRGLRAIVQKLLNENVKTKVPERNDLTGRLYREYTKLYPILRVLFPIDDIGLTLLCDHFIDLSLTPDEFEQILSNHYSLERDIETRMRALEIAGLARIYHEDRYVELRR